MMPYARAEALHGCHVPAKVPLAGPTTGAVAQLWLMQVQTARPTQGYARTVKAAAYRLRSTSLGAWR